MAPYSLLFAVLCVTTWKVVHLSVTYPSANRLYPSSNYPGYFNRLWNNRGLARQPFSRRLYNYNYRNEHQINRQRPVYPFRANTQSIVPSEYYPQPVATIDGYGNFRSYNPAGFVNSAGSYNPAVNYGVGGGGPYSGIRFGGFYPLPQPYYPYVPQPALPPGPLPAPAPVAVAPVIYQLPGAVGAGDWCGGSGVCVANARCAGPEPLCRCDIPYIRRGKQCLSF